MRKQDIADEIKSLRAEMRQLKGCQLRYFTLALIAAGGILGTRGIFGGAGPQALATLAPLAVIVPCWLTFFDKATTITRIAAYVRLLEELLSKNGRVGHEFVGFETALRRFRDYEDCHGPRREISLLNRQFWGQHFDLMSLRTRHRYWALHWWTFFSLAAVCVLLPFAFDGSLMTLSEPVAWSAVASVVLVVALAGFTFYLLINLRHGKYSYDVNEEVWRLVLASPFPNALESSAAQT